MKNKKKYFFLDRDGTIIHHVHYLKKKEQIKIYEFTIKALKILKSLGEIYIITNQSAVARGFLLEKNLIEINNIILKKINSREKLIKKIFYCPHHKSGTIKKYKKNCKFRKPNIGFIKKFKDIDRSKSWFIGDTSTDIYCGKKAKLNTILLKTGKTNKGDTKIKPNFKCENLLYAAKKIRKCYLKI